MRKIIKAVTFTTLSGGMLGGIGEIIEKFHWLQENWKWLLAVTVVSIIALIIFIAWLIMFIKRKFELGTYKGKLKIKHSFEQKDEKGGDT
ncbi:hypothetical protein [Spiroplasma endosymbiont of Labia minor]|uniref:hypothetical protein n=1 Tax=Spiroplasma endosymbiont of Labia minor TaxID=3066305 RepID=UPI0030CA65F6